MKTAIVIMAICAGMGGCATAPHVAPIERGTPVAFVIVLSQPARGTAAVHNTAVKSDAGTGALSGATVGALTGLTCGPLFFLCMPLGAVMGAGAGVAAGAVAGAAESLPKDKVAQLNERLKRLQQSVDPLIELRANVVGMAGKHWELTDDTSGRVVNLEVQALNLTADRNDNISLVMEVLVSDRNGATASTAKPAKPKRFVVVTQGSSLAAWLDERSDLPESQLHSACQQMATQVVSELAFN